MRFPVGSHANAVLNMRIDAREGELGLKHKVGRCSALPDEGESEVWAGHALAGKGARQGGLSQALCIVIGRRGG
jgi:hypothetical protein